MKKDAVIGKSMIVSLLVMTAGGLLLCGLVGLLVSNQVVPVNMSPVIIIALHEALILVCAYTAARRQTKKRLPVAVMIATAYMCIQLLTGTVFFSTEKIQLIGCLVTLGTGIVAGILSGMKKQRRR